MRERKSTEMNSIMEDSASSETILWLEETKFKMDSLPQLHSLPSTTRENHTLFDDLKDELNSLKELIGQMKSTELNPEVETELQTTRELLDNAQIFLSEHESNTDNNHPSLTQDSFDNFRNGIAASRSRLLEVKERRAMKDAALPWRCGTTRWIVCYAIIAAVFFVLCCCYWGARNYSSQTQENVLKVRLSQPARPAETTEAMVRTLSATVDSFPSCVNLRCYVQMGEMKSAVESFKLVVEDDQSINNSCVKLDQVFEEANLATHEEQTKCHKDNLSCEPEDWQTNLALTNLERDEVANPSKGPRVKSTLEEKDVTNELGKIHHILAVNDADSSTEEQQLGVNVAGIDEVVDASNEHVVVPPSQEEVSPSEEVISVNIEGTERMLTINDDNSHHNNHATCPMNDQSSLGEKKREEENEDEVRVLCGRLNNYNT